MPVEGVGDKASRPGDGQETAEHLDARPSNDTLQDEPAITGALVEGAVAHIRQQRNDGDMNTGQMLPGVSPSKGAAFEP